MASGRSPCNEPWKKLEEMGTEVPELKNGYRSPQFEEWGPTSRIWRMGTEVPNFHWKNWTEVPTVIGRNWKKLEGIGQWPKLEEILARAPLPNAPKPTLPTTSTANQGTNNENQQRELGRNLEEIWKKFGRKSGECFITQTEGASLEGVSPHRLNLTPWPRAEISPTPSTPTPWPSAATPTAPNAHKPEPSPQQAPPNNEPTKPQTY